MDKKRVIFCTKEHWPGVKYYLDSVKNVIVENFRDQVEVGYFEIPPNGFNPSMIHLLKNHPPDFLFLGGWDASIRNVVANVNKNKTKTFLEWCSPISQSELGGEIMLFIDVINFMQLGMLNYVSVCLETDYQNLKGVHKGFTYSPICFDTAELDKVKIERPDKQTLDCDLFCAANPRKNIFSQIMTLANFNEVKTHINFSRGEYIEATRRFLKNYEIHGWMTKAEYLNLIQKMDFAMQVSFSESFNIAAAEHMYYGIPTICSSFFPYVKGNKELESIMVKDPGNGEEIYDCIKNLISSKAKMEDLGAISRELVIKKNNENKDILKELYSKLIFEEGI